MHFGNFEIAHGFHELVFRHASRERARLEPDYVCMEDLYGGP